MSNEIGYLIQVNNDTKEGYQYPVSQDYLIGSSVQCNLKIADDGILDQHCRIKLVNDEVCVFSLNSLNPVFLNDEPVSEEGKPLKDHDKIRINDNHQLEWKTVTYQRICSRSLPLGNESSSVEVNARYSDSALVAWKNVDRLPEEHPDTNVQPENQASQQKNELVEDEAPELLKTEFVEKSNVSILCESDHFSIECENETKYSENTPVKCNVSKNPVSPFSVSNNASNSRYDVSKSFNQKDNEEMILKCSTKNLPEDEFDDLVMHQSTSQKPFHSTPKAVSGLKNQKNIRPSSSSLIELNLENTVEMDSSELQMCGDLSEKNEELCEKSTRKSFNHDEARKPSSASKKGVSTPTKRASESLNESRRYTRGRTSMLRKTFEENSCDNEVKSLTTPEKLTESHITKTLFAGDSEMENITDTITDYKSLNESSKAGFASVSDENDTCEGSFIDKYKMCNVVKSVPVSIPAVAKCARNLSYISPPENNRSQEYMDSMVSTPQKNSPSQRESIAENFNVSTASILSNTKDTSFDDSINTSLSSARKRRSTGFIPFVGTPSNEYRVTRKMSTPFSKSILSRTSVDFDNIGKHSSERSSTPFKLPSGKSSIRDSISCQPTIQESVSFEELEANNHEHDSINESKFRNITKRRGRRRFGESTFAAEDKILEESELKSDGSELENDSSFEEDNTVTSITQTSTFIEGCNELSAGDKTKTETVSNPLVLKSILTPLPKNFALKEKSAKRVTFKILTPAESTVDKEDITLSADESFAMINTRKPEADIREVSNSESLISDEELHVSDQQETEPSCNSISEPDDSSVMNSVEGKCDESSLNVTGVEYLAKIQSSLNDLSGVEQIQSPEPSPAKCIATETDDVVTETDEKVDSLDEVSEHSPINFTEMESSLAFSESSNRLNEEKSTETSNEVQSSKKIMHIAADQNSNDSSTKISCSPGVHLSGVKSLFRTSEKSRASLINKGIKCNLNFSLVSKNKTEIKDEKKIKSASASKFIGATKQTAGTKSSRLCKSLILTKTTPIKQKTRPVEEIRIEQPNITADSSENEVVVLDVCNKESTSIEHIIDTDSPDEERVMNYEIPEIVITDATFIDENANNEPIKLNENHEEEVTEYSGVAPTERMEVTAENHKEEIIEDLIVANGEQIEVNKTHEEDIVEHSKVVNDELMEVDKDHEEEVVEQSTVESPSEEQLEINNAEFETSDFEDKLTSDQDETLSSKNDITDDVVSPIITQIRRSAAIRMQSESKIQSENNSSTPISSATIVCEKEIESTTTSDAVLVELPCTALPSSESIQEPDNESQSSSDQNNSQISDILSSEYNGDTDSSKTGTCPSSCNNSQLSDFSTKDPSDFDSMKINMNESSCNVSQLSDTMTKLSDDLDISKKNVNEDTFGEQLTDSLFAEEPICPEKINNVNVKTKIVECLSAEIVLQNDVCEIAEKPDNTEPCDPDVNVSQCTSSSQDEGIIINASNALINDLYKRLENTPYPSSIEVTPTKTFNPISFPESTCVSSIECSSSIKPDTFNKPDLPLNKFNDEVLTPIKTYVRGSSTPQSAVRRCRKSSRIHRCHTDDSLAKSSTPLHDCSVVLDNLQTQSDVENAKEPKEVYKQVVAELNIKLVDIKEKIDEIQESSARKKSPVKMIEVVSCSQSALSADPISSPTSSQPSNDEDITSTISKNMVTAHGEQLEHQLENETVENTLPDQEESSGVPETTVNTMEVPIITENIKESQTISSTLVANEEENLERTATLSVDTTSDCRRSLRTRKERSPIPADGSPKRGVVTRNRQKAPSLYKKPFHCYLCLNYPETFNKFVRKTKIKQLEQDLNGSYDDKENVCSLLKVVDKPKKMEQSNEQLVSTALPVTTKIGRKPRRLKNVENITDSQNDGNGGKRSCSIVLPVLDPEIIKSPVKVDEEGNISLVKEPQIAPKRKRVTRAVKASEQKAASTASRTRQKPVKTVTFDEPVDKVVRSKATATKRNLRTQATTVEPEVTTRSRRTTVKNAEINQDEQIEIVRTIEIQLEPVDDVTEPVEKRTRSKRGTVAAKKIENIEDKTTVKVKPQRATKRAPELVEKDSQELSKKRRVRATAIDEVSTNETAKSENEDEIVIESPKRTRSRVKTNVPLPSSANTVAKSTKNKSLEKTNSSSLATKKRTRDAGESSAKNDAEKTVKKTRIFKSVELVEPIETSLAKKPAKKVTVAKEPIAKTSNNIPIPRMTRSRKTEIITNADVKIKIPLRKTHVAQKKSAAVPKSSPTIDADSQVNSKRARNVKTPVVATKRAIVTRSKNISIKKGRISTTLKTSTSTAKKSVGKSSPVKALPENNLPAASVRSTRRRAK